MANEQNKYIKENLLVKKVNLNSKDIKQYLDKSTNRIILVDYETKAVYYMNDKLKPNMNLSDFTVSSYVDEVKHFSTSMIKRWFKNTRYQTIKRYGDETYGETDRKFDCLDNGNSENVKEVIDMQYKELQVAIAKDLEKIKNFKLGIEDTVKDNRLIIFNEAHPVHSLYWTSEDEDPNVKWAWTNSKWKRITDRFILAASDPHPENADTPIKHIVNEEKGSETVTLTTENLPAHHHDYTPSGTVTSSFSGTYYGGHSHNMEHGHYGTTGYMSGNSSGSAFFKSYESRYPTGNISLAANGGQNSSGTDAAYGCTLTINVQHYHEVATANKPRKLDSSYYITSDYLTNTGGAGAFTPSGTVTSTFSATKQSSENTGSGTAVSTMSPYVSKYCWERIA